MPGRDASTKTLLKTEIGNRGDTLCPLSRGYFDAWAVDSGWYGCAGPVGSGRTIEREKWEEGFS